MRGLLSIWGTLILLGFVSCNDNQPSKTNNVHDKSSLSRSDNPSTEENVTYPTISNDNNGYKYNFKTEGDYGYSYNYDVEGYDEDGNYVYGNIDISGKYGDGYLYNEDGDEIYIDVEWVDYGVLEAVDSDGYMYELHVY